MIWRSAVNILWALVRNLFQKGHQCVLLEEDEFSWDWACSCGAWGTFHDSEVDAIKAFSAHVNGEKVVRK